MLQLLFLANSPDMDAICRVMKGGQGEISMREIDFSKHIIHDSAKPKYRWPTGAVATGDRVKLYLEIRGLGASDVYLELLHGVSKTNHKMQKNNFLWEVEIQVPEEASVLWYWFVIKIDEVNKIYYGANIESTSGNGRVYWTIPPAFQITVYEKDFLTPNWFKNTIIYQIFVDRFAQGDPEQVQKGIEYHKNMGRDVVYHENWEELPDFRAREGKEHYQPVDYFGGDLQGVIDQLEYLQEMGVGAIYLTPIFEAASNHRYNVADYCKIDPMLGTEETFDRLIKEAEQRGIRIILDGVISHTGDDSIYFNRYKHYDSIGACQGPQSPYYSWYTFYEFPDNYERWWGFDSLPQVNVQDSSWMDFMISGEDSVVSYWTKKGIAGLRLDLADELSDESIENLRNSLKYSRQDNVLIGEVWQDATRNLGDGVNRTYALGHGLDSVTNYPLKDVIIGFLLQHIDANELRQFLVAQSQNYPKEMYYAMMNMLSTHDTARIRTLMSAVATSTDMTREQQAHLVLTPKQEERGAALQKLAAVMQFALPGVPCIYYGDEVGMTGMYDPFNRGAYQVRDKEIQEFYKHLAILRKQEDALRTGYFLFNAHSKEIFGILRFCMRGQDAFGNVAKDGIFLILVNRSSKPGKIVVDMFSEVQIQTDEQLAYFTDLDFESATCALSGEVFPISNGLIEVLMPEESARILELIWI